MRKGRRYLIVLSVLAALAVVSSIVGSRYGTAQGASPNSGPTPVLVTNTSAQPVPASLATHVGQPVGNLVTVYSTAATTKMYRILPDGSGYTSQWSIPAGQVLVITDYSWAVNLATPNQACLVDLTSVGTVTTSLDREWVVTDGSGRASGHRQLTTAVASGRDASINSGSCPAEVFIHGYLAPAQ